jgi:hypothetical protein
MLLDMFRFMYALVGTIVVIEHYDHSPKSVGFCMGVGMLVSALTLMRKD